MNQNPTHRRIIVFSAEEAGSGLSLYEAPDSTGTGECAIRHLGDATPCQSGVVFSEYFGLVNT